VLQCAAVCCSVLQCAAVCCSVLQCAAVCCSVLQCVAVFCNVLQCVAVCCSVLQCVAVCCSVECAAFRCMIHTYLARHGRPTWWHHHDVANMVEMPPAAPTVSHTSTKMVLLNGRQILEDHLSWESPENLTIPTRSTCTTNSILQHTATRCNTLQHAASPRKAPSPPTAGVYA